METKTPVIEIKNLERRYGKVEAVNGLNLTVKAGSCYGFFGRNGAGKTTTIRCLLNLLQPGSGTVRVFGLDPRLAEVEVKSRLSYVPDTVAFYPWMTIAESLGFLASFRRKWNRELERELLGRFQLDSSQKASRLSKGQKTQVALIGAVCAEPELLVLDEPTSGLDPIVRREFIETVIGAYHATDPENRTVFVSTHLISEFEGLIDDFTIIEAGKELLTMSADAARERYQRIAVEFAEKPEKLDLPGALSVRQSGREVEILVNGNATSVMEKLRTLGPKELNCRALSLEEVFVAAGTLAREAK